MEDEKVIIEVDIDTSKVITDIDNLNKEVAKLTDELSALTEAENKDTKAIIAKQAELKAAKSEVNSLTTTLVKLTKAEKDEGITINKLEAENRKLRESIKNLDITNKDYKKNIDEVNKKINENTALISENSDKFKQDKINVGNYTESIIKAAPQLEATSTAFKGFNAVIKANPIGLLISAFELLMYWFNETETGANVLKTIMNGIKVVFGIVVDAVVNFGKKIYEVVTNPKKYLLEFINFIETNIVNRIKSFAVIFNGLMEGDFKKVGNGMIQMATGVENATDKITKAAGDLKNGVVAIGKQIKEAAFDIIALEKEINNLTRTTNKLVSNLEAQREIQMQIAEDDTRGWKERQKAYVQADILVNKINEAEIKLAKKNLERAKLQLDNAIKTNARELEDFRNNLNDAEIALTESENKKTLSLLEQREKRIKAKKDEFEQDLDYYIDGFNLVRDRNLKIIENEKNTIKQRYAIFEETKKKANDVWNDEIKLIEKYWGKKVDLNKLLTIQNEVERVRELKKYELNETTNNRILELLRERNAFEIQFSEISLKLAETKALQEIKILSNRLKKGKEIYEKEIKNALDSEKTLSQAKIDIYEKYLKAYKEIKDFEKEISNETQFQLFESELNNLTKKYEYEKQLAEENGIDTTNIEKKFSRAKRDIWIDEQTFKGELASTVAANIATIFGETTEIGKAAGVTQVAIDTYVASLKAFKAAQDLPFPANFIVGATSIAAVIAQGVATTQKILSVNEGSSIDGGGSVTASASSAVGTTNQALISSAPAVGQGIINRNVGSQIIQPNANLYTSVLVVDEVTYNQNKQSEINTVAVI